MKRVLVRMDDITHTRLKADAKKLGHSLNFEIVMALESWTTCEDSPPEAIDAPVQTVEEGVPAAIEATVPVTEGVSATEATNNQKEDQHQLIQDIISGRSGVPRVSKLVSAPRAEEAGVPNCPVCATDMVEVEVRGRRSMVCPRCAAG